MSVRDKIDGVLRELRAEYEQPHDYPWIVAFSGGKDSTLQAQLVFEMLLGKAPSDRRRVVHLMNNDTQVESPLLALHARKVLEKMGKAAEALRLPMQTHVTVPEEDQTFWVNVIGRGYAPPNRRFRWCTDRMKILPTTNFIRSQVSGAGQVVLLLGVRKAESSNRAQTIEAHTVEGQRLSPHENLKGCMVFRPIVDLTTDELWQVLLQRQPPWGGTHRDLITLYKNAQAGECPLVIDRSQAPSCGTNSGRFGCWTCTVVKKDKSGEAMADAGFEEYGDLLAFRDWLRAFQWDRTKRQLEKRNGQLTIIDDQIMPGPFTIEAREEILGRLLALQATLGRELITPREVDLIKRIWTEDCIRMISQVPAISRRRARGAGRG